VLLPLPAGAFGTAGRSKLEGGRALKFRCPNCKRKLHIADEKAGKQAVCPSCRTSISIPASEEVAAICPTCGHELIRGETVCTKCLTYVGEDDKKDAARKDPEIGADTVEVTNVDGEAGAPAPEQEEQAPPAAEPPAQEAPSEKAEETPAPEPGQPQEGKAAKKVLTAADKRRHVILLIVTVIVVTLSILMVLKNR